jgi:hypothetical protein
MNELEANAIITDEATGGKYDRGERSAIIFNPLNPPVLGDFWVWGDTPKPLAKGLCPSALPSC